MEYKIKELIKGYLQKADKKLNTAKRLFDLGDYEDAVSRAYYAVYHATQALLLTEGVKGESHKGLITLFGLLFVKTGKFDKNIGKILMNLKDDRESGDYEIFSYIEMETAQTALQEAEEFLRESNIYFKKIGLE